MSLLPVQVYGLEIPPGQDVLTPARQEFDVPNAVFRITMAAIDPTDPPQADEDGNIPSVPRATLKIVRPRFPDMMDELDDDRLQRLMYGSDDSDDDSDDDSKNGDDEPNGGPSDPAKTKKARREAALKKLIEAAQAEEDSDEEMADGGAKKTNGTAKKVNKKGKKPATSSDEDSDEDDEDDEEVDWQELVVCTLDTERNFQQPLDITIAPNEDVHFVVKGTHTVYLSGNYVIDADEDDSSEEDEEDDYDYPEGIDEYDSEDSEIDELDDIQDPRVTEVESDEEEAPKLVAADTKKGKNKRAAPEEAEDLDAMIAKAAAATDTKLSKKQQKKLKNNKGEAVAAEADKKAAETAKEAPAKGDKKVQFAKNLEQGPTGSAASEKPAGKAASVGVKVVQGVTVDDRKAGSGRSVKKGDRVDVRYIGKLADGKVFDSNKKGKPFSFKAGDGQVIKGWDVGIIGMSVGGERRLTIPAHLAYGSKALPGIPANSQLIFDVKLLGIK
ncbi:peptidylprolyl isomerase fpr3 [Diatrype stigma]|uniref:peptidylprolyl isomerase n=1 Tax=Diatrype stigma TaxID=117547 RepID=A0AAN9UW88_9PEZI